MWRKKKAGERKERKEKRAKGGRKEGALEAVGPDRGKKEKVVEVGKSPSRIKKEAALRNILFWQFGESTSKTAEGERGDRAFSGTAGASLLPSRGERDGRSVGRWGAGRTTERRRWVEREREGG